MLVIRKKDDCDEDNDDNDDAGTSKLHLVIDDTEAEHVRIRHQHFLVLTKIIKIIISIIKITTTIMIRIKTMLKP